MFQLSIKRAAEITDNYRRIAIANSLSRVSILENKIELEYRNQEAEEQAGFRVKESTVDHLFCVTQVIEKKVAVN